MFSKEFNKHDEKMTQDIEAIKELIENAENQAVITVNGVTYPTSYLWRKVAELALDLANEQEWFKYNEE